MRPLPQRRLPKAICMICQSEKVTIALNLNSGNATKRIIRIGQTRIQVADETIAHVAFSRD